MEAHLLSLYSKEEATALLQKFVSRSDSPGDETDSNVTPVPQPERTEAEPERTEPPEPERSRKQSQEAEDNVKGRNVPDDGDSESEKEVTDVTPSQDGDDLQSDVEKFFSKKPNALKRKFHYIIRKAACEAKIYGKQRLKDVKPAAKKYIFDRIVSKLPALVDYEREFDQKLSRILTQAKFYKQQVQSKSKSPVSHRKTPSPSKKHHSPGKSLGGKRSSPGKSSSAGGNRKSSGGKTNSPELPRSKDVKSKIKKNNKSSACKDLSKTFQGQEQQGESTGASAVGVRDKVDVMKGYTVVAKGVIVAIVDEMFAKVKLLTTLDGDVELYEAIDEKTSLKDLSQTDVFVWKTDYLKHSKSDVSRTTKRIVQKPQRLASKY